MTENEALQIVANPQLGWAEKRYSKALKIIRNALEKQKAKNPIDKIAFFECPTCGSVEILGFLYCAECGQKLDWGKGE